MKNSFRIICLFLVILVAGSNCMETARRNEELYYYYFPVEHRTSVEADASELAGDGEGDFKSPPADEEASPFEENSEHAGTAMNVQDTTSEKSEASTSTISQDGLGTEKWINGSEDKIGSTTGAGSSTTGRPDNHDSELAASSISSSSNDTALSPLDRFPTVLYPPIAYEIVADTLRSIFFPVHDTYQKNRKKWKNYYTSKLYNMTSAYEEKVDTEPDYDELNFVDENENGISVDWMDRETIKTQTNLAIDKTIDYLTRLKQPDNVEGIMNAGLYSFTHISSLCKIYGSTLYRLMITHFRTEHTRRVMETFYENVAKEVMTAYTELEKPLYRVFEKMIKVFDDPEVEKLWEQLQEQLDPLDDYINP